MRTHKNSRQRLLHDAVSSNPKNSVSLRLWVCSTPHYFVSIGGDTAEAAFRGPLSSSSPLSPSLLKPQVMSLTTAIFLCVQIDFKVVLNSCYCLVYLSPNALLDAFFHLTTFLNYTFITVAVT